MSVYTALRSNDLPTAAKLQRLWAECVLSKLIDDIGGYPRVSTEWKLMRYGAGAGQASRGVGLTVSEAAIDRLQRNVDIAIWVESQLRDLGALCFAISYLGYVQALNAEEIAERLQSEPKDIIDRRLDIARNLNRRVKHVIREAETAEISWRLTA